MQLPSRDGIICDACGLTYQYSFTYYSYDFRRVMIALNRLQTPQSILQTRPTCSMDYCMDCYNKHTEIIVSNFDKIQQRNRKKALGICCELTGKVVAGNFTYYYCCVAEATIHCAPNATPQVTVSERVVEFNVCTEEFTRLREVAATIAKPKLTDATWSTKT